jgi:26S proteasome regulatory subunit N12
MASPIDLAQVSQQVAAFAAEVAQEDESAFDAKRASGMLSALKLRLAPCVPATPDAAARAHAAELMLYRETLEHALLLHARLHDSAGFARSYAQLRPLYYDSGLAAALPAPSARMWLIVGLNLTRLLSQGQIADFHTELELIPHAAHSTERYVAFAVALEQAMMEGGYRRVLRARADAPAPCYHAFVDTLASTVRNDIADCTERAFDSLSVPDARRWLMFDGTAADGSGGGSDAADEFTAFVASRSWQMHDGRVFFKHSGPLAMQSSQQQQQQQQVAAQEVPAHKLIHDTLSYSRELERIV